MKIIDVHAHYGKWFFPIEADSVDAILKMMKKNGIIKTILSSSLALLYDFHEGNARLAAAINDHPQLYAYLFLNPNYVRESLFEMEKYLSESPKFLGLKFYSDGYIGQPLDCDGHRKFLEILQKKYPYGVVLAHCYSYSTALQLLELAKDFPKLNFIMGHMGGDEWRETLGIVKQVNNVYLELCSGVPVLGKIEETVSEVGTEKIMFGSDLTLHNPSWTLGMIENAQIPDEKKTLILHGNAARLFHL